MLGKLIKHELNATGRIFLPLYFIILILSLVNRVLITISITNGPLDILRGFTIAAYSLSIVATLIVTFVIMIMRFYRNLITDEGYLMLTLPVKSSQLINSKLITSILWNIASIIIVGISLLIMLGTTKNMDMLKEFIDFVHMGLKSSFGNSYVLLIIEFIIMIILSLIQQVLLIYISIAIGHLFNSHRVLGAFVSYIAITTIIQILVTVILMVWARVAGSSLDALEAVPELVFPFSIIFSVICNVVYYFGTNYIFKNKLNLE